MKLQLIKLVLIQVMVPVLHLNRFINIGIKRTWGDLNPRPWDPKSHVIFLARLQAHLSF